MATIRTTSGYEIHHKSPEFVTIYAPDGSPHSCAPVDAREILAGGLGYTSAPPLVSLIFDEQQPEQQPIDGDAHGQEAQEVENGQEAQEVKPKRGRPKNAH